MAIVSVPYNPWKENLAAQIGMMLGQNLLEKSNASAANKKVAAFMGEIMKGVDPTYENAAVQNEIIARQNAVNGGFAGGQSPIGTSSPMEAGGPGAPGGGIPVEAVAAAMGAAPPQGGYNIAAVDPRSQQMIPGAMRPDRMLARAPVTPMIDVVKALQLVATPRFAPYASALFKTVNDLVGMNTTMRENAYKDFDTNKRGQVGAWQTKLASDIASGRIDERTGRNMMAAIGSFIGNPMEYSANQERTEATDRGSILDYEGRKYAADQSLKGSLANAARPVYGGGGGGYQPYDGTKRDAMTFFTTTERDTFNQLIKAYGPAPTQEQVAASRQAARDEANRQTAKMYPDSPFAVEYNRAENEKRDVAEFTAMAMGNQDFSKALSDAARQGEAAVRRVASQALLPNGRKPTAAQIESLVRTIMGQVKPDGRGDTQKTPQMPYKGA